MSEIDPATVDPRAVRNISPERWHLWPKPTPQPRGKPAQHYALDPYSHVREMPNAPVSARAFCCVCRRFFPSESANYRHRDYARSSLTECVPLPRHSFS